MMRKPSPFPKSFLAGHRLLRRGLSDRHHPRPTLAKSPATPPPDKFQGQILVVDMEAWLMRSPLSTFPYFMLIAVEAGGFVRGLLLLFLYPFLCLIGHDMRLKAMVMVSFLGLREEEVARVCKAVLPKFLLGEVAMEGLEVVRKARKVVVVSTEFPTVMVEAFLKEYLSVEAVVGREVRVMLGGFVGVVEEEEREVVMERVRGLVGVEMDEMKSMSDGAVGLVGGRGKMHYIFSHCCKETYILSEVDKKAWRPLPRDRYPKPLVFHDGRLAFTPTPSAALAMYTYLPMGIALAVFRSVAFLLLPYCVSVPLAALTGMRSRLIAGPSPDAAAAKKTGGDATSGRLYVCNHRTLLDPITVAAGLRKPVTAVTYSLSPVTELIAPIRTARLTRDRDEDRRKMAALLARGDLVVCPEGTTCREPYLLRFSPLFAELAAEVAPVGLDTRVDMFYGTSTKPTAKWLDAFYFMMNTRPEYRVEFLECVVTAPAEGEAAGHGHSIDVANRVQRLLGEALGFELTGLTRKDKYMMLAGNEGVVKG